MPKKFFSRLALDELNTMDRDFVAIHAKLATDEEELASILADFRALDAQSNHIGECFLALDEKLDEFEDRSQLLCTHLSSISQKINEAFRVAARLCKDSATIGAKLNAIADDAEIERKTLSTLKESEMV